MGQNPWGRYNPEMTVISFQDDSGKILANMIHYGCHGTAAGVSTLISRDWPGVMTDTMEKQTGAITAFFNGPEGDVGPRLSNGQSTGMGDIRYVYELGHTAALDAVRIFRTIAAYRKEARLQSGSAVVKIPLKKRISREEAQALCEKYKGHTVNWQGKLRGYGEKVLASYEEGYEDQETCDVPQAVIRLGDVAFTSTPFESFSEIGLRIDSMYPALKILSLSNTNGSHSYFATEDQICLGGYEIIMHRYGNIQPYCEHADWALIKGSVENIKTILEEEAE